MTREGRRIETAAPFSGGGGFLFAGGGFGKGAR